MPCQWYSAYVGLSPCGKPVTGAYVVSPNPWPAFQNRGQPANRTTVATAAPHQPARASPEEARSTQLTMTARNGAAQIQ
jgi:hypothetical protein